MKKFIKLGFIVFFLLIITSYANAAWVYTIFLENKPLEQVPYYDSKSNDFYLTAQQTESIFNIKISYNKEAETVIINNTETHFKYYKFKKNQLFLSIKDVCRFLGYSIGIYETSQSIIITKKKMDFSKKMLVGSLEDNLWIHYHTSDLFTHEYDIKSLYISPTKIGQVWLRDTIRNESALLSYLLYKYYLFYDRKYYLFYLFFSKASLESLYNSAVIREYPTSFYDFKQRLGWINFSHNLILAEVNYRFLTFRTIRETSDFRVTRVISYDRDGKILDDVYTPNATYQGIPEGSAIEKLYYTIEWTPKEIK